VRNSTAERGILQGTGPEEQRLPGLLADAGDAVALWFRDFMGQGITNPHTRSAYGRAIDRFLTWCSDAGVRGLDEIEPRTLATYLAQHRGSEATVKQHLAALRLFFSGLSGGGFIAANPASSVRAPQTRGGRGRTPLLIPAETGRFLESIDTSSIAGLRDRAILGVMVYAFARVGAVVALRGDDYFERDSRHWLRLRRLAARPHEVPVHRRAQAYLDGYLAAWGGAPGAGPLFRSMGRQRQLTGAALTRTDVLRMVKRRAHAGGLPPRVSCHTFRASGIRAYLESGGMLQTAQSLAGHKSARSTRLYSPPAGPISPDDIDRIAI
jgi:integrase